MSADLKRELEKISIELDDLKKSAYSGMKIISPEIKLKRYHALIKRISKSAQVDTTPDNLFLGSVNGWKNPFGKGKAAERIVRVMAMDWMEKDNVKAVIKYGR